jgi:hypothetical protein
MTSYNSKVVALAGTVDGANKTFTTPNRYVAGTLRLVLNGQVYEADDDRKGWVEINDTTIELDQAPRVGGVLQAFYQNMDSGSFGLDQVVGSPFDPTGVLP